MDIIEELKKIDTKIVEQRKLLDYMLEQERLNHTKTFKPSRAVRHKLEKLERQRKHLAKASPVKFTKAELYEVELNKRQFLLDEEEKALQDLITQLAATQPMLGSTPLSDLVKRINTQRARVRNRKRALLNWIGLDNAPISVSINKKPRTRASKISNIPTAQPVRESILDVDPISAMLRRKVVENHEKPLIAENNATLELIGDPSDSKGDNL